MCTRRDDPNPSDLNSTWVDGDEADGLADVGEKVSHICTVKNEGTTSLVSFCITGTSFREEGCQKCPEARTLAPGASFTCEIDTEVNTYLQNSFSYLPLGVFYLFDYANASDDRVVGRICFGSLFPTNETWWINHQLNVQGISGTLKTEQSAGFFDKVGLPVTVSRRTHDPRKRSPPLQLHSASPNLGNEGA